MIEHTEDPVGHASSKVAQYVSMATLAAEVIAQVRQQRLAVTAAADEKAAVAARAHRASSLAAARVRWGPILDARLCAQTGVVDAGLAWAVAQGWRDVDPEAALASDRALQRLRELRPDVMDRYDRLTADGVDPIEAMRRVAPFMDRPPARAGEQASNAARDTQSSASRQHYIDTGAYLNTDGSEGARGPEPKGTSTRVHGEPERVGDILVADLPHLVAGLTARTAPQVATDGFPEPLTGEVLAAGRVKPKDPASSAPASVRASSLATAARAASRSR
jgi:hypothetical protein